MDYGDSYGLGCGPLARWAGVAAQSCRVVARAVLFDRVPRRVVLWMGLGVMAAAITLGMWCTFSLGPACAWHGRVSPGVFFLRP